MLGHDVKIQPIVLGGTGDVRVVADYDWNIAAEFARAIAQQQIDQAMVLLGDEKRDAFLFRTEDKMILHGKTLRDLIDRPLQRQSISRELTEVTANSLKELASFAIRVLVRIQYVRPMPGKHLRQRRHDTTPIGTRNE
jgi:hypothetical protein